MLKVDQDAATYNTPLFWNVPGHHLCPARGLTRTPWTHDSTLLRAPSGRYTIIGHTFRSARGSSSFRAMRYWAPTILNALINTKCNHTWLGLGVQHHCQTRLTRSSVSFPLAVSSILPTLPSFSLTRLLSISLARAAAFTRRLRSAARDSVTWCAAVFDITNDRRVGAHSRNEHMNRM